MEVISLIYSFGVKFMLIDTSSIFSDFVPYLTLKKNNFTALSN